MIAPLGHPHGLPRGRLLLTPGVWWRCPNDADLKTADVGQSRTGNVGRACGGDALRGCWLASELYCLRYLPKGGSATVVHVVRSAEPDACSTGPSRLRGALTAPGQGTYPEGR